MKKIKQAVCMTLALAAVTFFAHCVQKIAGNTSETGNSVSAMLYNPNGTPAAHAIVRFYKYGTDPRTGLAKRTAATPVDSTTTNASGNYTAALDTGTYNILATNNGNATFQDSITVVKDSTVNPPIDTLKTPGSLQGKIALQPGDDARTVFILFLGTNTFFEPADSLGNFTTLPMAKGKYQVRILTTLDAYTPKDTVLSVTAGVIDTLPGPIVLQYTGIPVPSGLKINYDTLKQIVNLSWNKPTTGRTVAGYNVYRKQQDSTSFVALKSGVKDTVFSDSLVLQGDTYEYRIASVDTNGTEGVKSGGTVVKIVSGFALIDSLPSVKPADYFAIGPDSSFFTSYIGDTYIKSFTKTGIFIDTIAKGNLSSPGAITVDSHNRIYVLSSGMVMKYSTIDSLLLSWNDSNAVQIASDTNSNLFLLYNNRNTVGKFDTTGKLISSIAVQANDALVVDRKGEVYVGDRICSCIKIFDNNLLPLGSIAAPVAGRNSINIKAVDDSGRIYVRELVAYASQGILEIHVFNHDGVFVGKFQPPRGGGESLIVIGNQLYLCDRYVGISIYKLPF
jgi:hypothetical protein